jgi:hypothetical protein
MGRHVTSWAPVWSRCRRHGELESYIEVPFFAVGRYNSYRSDSVKAPIKIQETWLEYLSILPSPFSPSVQQAQTGGKHCAINQQ